MLIECNSLCGGMKSVPKEKVVLRPAAYALIMSGATVLLVNTRSTGKYYLSGGGVDTGERIEDALRREVREETGIEVEVGRFLGFKEDFFYYDPWDEAYHSLLFSMRADRQRLIWRVPNRSKMGKQKSPNG